MSIEIKAYTPSVAPGPYQAVVTDIVEKAAKSDPTNIFRIWEFSLKDGRTVSGSSSLATSPKSKGGKWVAALLGRAPVVGESVELIGKWCTVIVELDDNGYERVTTVAPPEQPGPVSPVRPLVEERTAQETAGETTEDALPF